MRTRVLNINLARSCLSVALLSAGWLYAQSKLPVGININDNSPWDKPVFIDLTKGMSDWHCKNADWSGGYSSGCPLDSIELDTDGYPLEVPQTVSGYAPQMVEAPMQGNCAPGRYVLTYEGDGDIHIGVGGSVLNSSPGRMVLDIHGGGNSAFLAITRSTRGNHVRTIRVVPENVENTYSDTHPFLPAYLDVVKNFHCLRFMGWQGTNCSKQVSWSRRRLPTAYTQGSSQEYGPALEYAIMMCNEVDADLWWCMPHMADDEYMVEAARLIKAQLKPSLKWYCEYTNETWNWGPGFCQFGWINGSDGVGACPGAADSIRNAILQIWQNGGDFGTTNGYMANRLFRHARSVFTGVDQSRLVRVVGGHAGWFGISQSSVEYTFDHGDGCDALAIAPYFGFEGGGSAVSWFCDNTLSATPEAIVDSMAVAQQHNRAGLVQHGQYAQQKGIDLIYYEGGASYGYSACLFQSPLEGIVKASAYSDGMYDLALADIAMAADPQIDCRLYVPLILFGEPHHYGHLDSASQIYLPRAQQPAKFRALMDGNVERTLATAPVVSRMPATPAARRPRTVLGFTRRPGAISQFARACVDAVVYATDGRRVSAQPKAAAGAGAEARATAVYVVAPGGGAAPR